MMAEVEALFPIPMEVALVASKKDIIFNRALRRALAKEEVFKEELVSGNCALPQFSSIVDVYPSLGTSTSWDVFTMGGFGSVGPIAARKGTVSFHFSPDRTLLIQDNNINRSYTVVGILDPTKTGLNDVSPVTLEWIIDYTVACLKEQEGMMGLSSQLRDVPIEFGDQSLYDDGKAAREELEVQLDDRYFGLFSSRK